MEKFEIKIKPSELSKQEKRELLWQCFDILFGIPDQKDKNVNKQKHENGKGNIRNK